MARKLPDHVLLLHNEPETSGSGAESVMGVMDQVRAVERALISLGIRVERAGVRGLADAGRCITRSSAPVVFNLVEAFPGHSGDAELIPTVSRTFGKGVTGNDTPALLLTLDKWKTKAILQAAGITCPDGVLIHPEDKRQITGGDRRLHNTLPWSRRSPPVSASLPPAPWIVKPLSSDASEGITCDSIVSNSNFAALQKQVARIHNEFDQAALVEACVGEREINVSLFQTAARVRILPLAEIDFTRLKSGEPKIVDYDAKWKPASRRYKATRRIVPAALPETLARRIRSVAHAAWKATGCRHYARVDMRLDAGGRMYVLEINANPDISPDAGYVAALNAAGISFEAFVGALVGDAYKTALRRSTATVAASGCSGASVKRRVHKQHCSIRRSRATDRAAMVALLQQPEFFKAHEVVTGLEVLDDAHRDGPTGHYQSFVAIQARRVVGWICFGPTPCTEGTFDVYWIVVAPGMQRKGVGSAMLSFAEDQMEKAEGRMSLLETSGRPDYAPTRRFYTNMGYAEASRIPDFYAPGDDKLTFAKMLLRRSLQNCAEKIRPIAAGVGVHRQQVDHKADTFKDVQRSTTQQRPQ